MSITVHHRADRLLQRNTREGCPKHLEETLTGKVIYPAHEALLKFINDHLIAREFASLEQLEDALAAWPAYYAERVPQTDKGFSRLFIDCDREIIACPLPPSGQFEVARFE